MTRTRYSTAAIVLHWLIAALIVLQVVLAGRMDGRTPAAFAVIQFHKSVGITVLLFSLARLALRLRYPPPPNLALASWERRLSRVTHWAFYGVMILMPLSGWLLVSTARYNVPTLLFGAVGWPHLPWLPDLAPAAKAAWHSVAKDIHALVMKGGYALAGLHVAGALKHQLSAPASVLPRMLPGARAGRLFEPRLLLVVAAFVAVAAFGRLYQPARHIAPPWPKDPPPVAEPVIEASPATAAAPPVPVADAQPAVWRVQRGSTLAFATAWSGEPIRGRFDRWTADILFSPDALDRSRVRVAIDVASIGTGDAQRDASLPTADWFDADAHPRATFTATRFERVDEGRFVAHGRLSLRGVSQPLDLPFRLKIDGDNAEVSGVTTLDRTVFGIGQGEWTSTEQIPAAVTVRIALKARRMSTPPPAP